MGDITEQLGWHSATQKSPLSNFGWLVWSLGYLGNQDGFVLAHCWPGLGTNSRIAVCPQIVTILGRNAITGAFDVRGEMEVYEYADNIDCCNSDGTDLILYFYLLHPGYCTKVSFCQLNFEGSLKWDYGSN